MASWTCGSDPTPYTASAKPWVYSDGAGAVAQVACPATTVTCNPTYPTTCSHLAENASDDVVYANAAVIPYQLDSTHASCAGVISGKINYYHQNHDTRNDPACLNVQRAINDAVNEGSCPHGLGQDAGNSWTAWPYNVSIGGGDPTGQHLADPVSGQPPLLLYLGCHALLRY